MSLDCENLPQGKFSQPNINCDQPQGTGIPIVAVGNMEFENAVLMEFEDGVIMDYES